VAAERARAAPEAAARSGAGGDLAAIMRMPAEEPARRAGFAGCIAGAVPRMPVAHLGTVRVPAGRMRPGRRDGDHGVRREARYRPFGSGSGEESASAAVTKIAGPPGRVAGETGAGR
jgi:hypothetical protein